MCDTKLKALQAALVGGQGLWQVVNMKNISFSFLAALSLATFTLSTATPAFAQTPPSVLQPYKAYNAAMQSKDYKTALREGKAAWKAAEKELGGNKTTGDLAFNYGFLEKAQGTPKDSIKALTRSVELAASPAVRVEREAELVGVLDATGDFKTAAKRAEAGLEYAMANGMGNSVFAAELMVFEINECNRRAGRAAKKNLRGERLGSRVSVKSAPEEYLARIQAQCAKRGEQALAIFNANPTLARPRFVVAAANAVGYSKEREGDFKGAAMAYQNSRDMGEESLGRMHPLMRHTIGRWLNARQRLDFNGDLDAAQASGMKEMWPYVQDSPKVKATSLGKADFGTSVINNQRLSGHVIFLTDIDDAGRPTNIRVLDAQPGDAYVKMSKEALMKSVYPAKSAGEPSTYRKDVAVPYTYIVYDRNTQDTY